MQGLYCKLIHTCDNHILVDMIPHPAWHELEALLFPVQYKVQAFYTNFSQCANARRNRPPPM